MPPFFKKVSRYRRIVAVGPRHSGKSVLLASLLDHLRKDPARFLRTTDEWIRHQVVPYPGDFPALPLDRILKEASEAALWPEVTVKPAALRFSAQNRKAWKRDLVLDFIDFPGENLADFLGQGDFQAWSDRVTDLFPDPLDPPSVEGMAQLRKAESENASPESLAEIYAKVVVEATRRGRYLTTPASLCSRVFETSSTSENEDFAPLKNGNRNRNFLSKFNAYQECYVRPLEKLIANADALIIPIDVGWILSGGPSVLRDQHALLSSLGELLARLDSIWARLASFLGRSFTPVDDSKFPGRLSSIVLVATKIDLFRPEDRSRLEDLVRALGEPVIRGAGFHGIQVLYTACSAVRSTTDSPSADGSLNGFREGKPVSVTPPKIPERWPDQWDPKDFRFPRLDPRIARNGLYPPAHIHLDRVVRSIIEA
ncbi:MAG: YcjX family protein [Verrucomicrobiota bacterium]